jgi:hypothetical protein
VEVVRGEGAAELGQDAQATLGVSGRRLVLERVRIDSRAPAPAVMAERGAVLDQVRVVHRVPFDGSSVVLGGNATVTGLTVEGACGTALELGREGGDLRTVRLEGFRRRGMLMAGGDVMLRDVRMQAADDPADRAAGLVVATDAAGSLRIDGLESLNTRPALDLAGALESELLDGLVLDLRATHNDLAGEEAGVRLALARGPEGERRVTGSRITGYDVGLDVVRAHDDPTTLVLGDRGAAGANRFVRNTIGLRVASEAARVVLQEDRNRNLLGENGAAVVVEAGAVSLENVRLENNQTGVIVRGGIADLGGGPLGSTGGNVLWPQAGAFAVVNESPSPVAARFNLWGGMRPFLGGEGAPISDARRNPQAGRVDASDPR